MNYSKRKISITILVAAIILSLVSLLVIVPLVFGEGFVSFSSKLIYAGEGASMKVVYPNGSVLPVKWIGLMVNITNSYIVPVEVRYNGFEFVWLIYNQTVADPADVVSNKDFLVWGAFRAAYSIHYYATYGFYGGPGYWPNRTGYESGYDYYAAHKDRSNFTKAIRPGSRQYHVFVDISALPLTVWGGQNYKSHHPVSPGTYHIYVIAYGKVSKPINLTVTSVLWSR